MGLLLRRMVRASMLEAELYEEVERDKTALSQAIWVVLLSSFSAGIGSATLRGLGSLISIGITALISWFIWAYIVYFIGVKILPTKETISDPGELLRTIGFSSSPGVIRILGIIPGLYNFVFLLAQIWMLIAMVIAVRQALDYRSTLRAVFVCIIGWFIQIFIFAFIYAFFSPEGRL